MLRRYPLSAFAGSAHVALKMMVLAYQNVDLNDRGLLAVRRLVLFVV
jgi:hypothetical protein